ncbi:hypothetical protein K491DRAFT_666479 [Lophiostoma macrostomum CBS 122681]|uniref:F-box domain-containing protein n=1 Tax=Lophiostoma macrostomum CBS 122681 TaxID=1314788 RepID=A0A6A6SV38_9PLEO|nr:hypothetical protein K491DRAFT_666479 [Lophiostoma macrostomum CBS 122681]
MHPASRQTLLGPSPDNDLAIINVEHARCAAERSPLIGSASILQLPQELLVTIIKLAVFRPRDPHGCPDCKFSPDAACAKALSHVCRCISGLVQPMLFHTITFDGTPSTVPPKKNVLRLHRTLRENPSLREHCRSLSISVSDVPAPRRIEDWAVVKNLAFWLTRVRCLENYGGFEGSNEYAWNLIRMMKQNMEHVRHWRLTREGWGLYLDQGLDVMWPKLEKLEFHGISQRNTRPLLLDPKLFRTASITSLSLSDYEETPHATAQLLQLPAKLEHFTFASFYNNPHTMNYPMFQSWLSHHSQTLISISIGSLSSNGGENKHIFDATLFSNLESLTLSKWQMTTRPGGLMPFTTENEKILGPRVKVFGWDFHVNDQHTEDWSDFGEREVAWLRQLARSANSRKAALTTIEIAFRPWDWNYIDTYPWGQMVSIRDELWERNGIELVCDTPLLPESEWVKWQEEKAAQDLLYEESAQKRMDAALNMDKLDSDSELEEEVQIERPPWFHGGDIRNYFDLS